MTKSSLLKFFEHEIVVKIWDSKDLCSPRARFDKPKPFKFPKSKHFFFGKFQNFNSIFLDENVEETVKVSVMELCNKYLKQIPIELHDKMERKLPNQNKGQGKLRI